MATPINRRRAVALGGALALGGLVAARPAAASDVLPLDTWQLRWAPEASRDGLAAFEGIEDDRADSHPTGQPHIFVQDNNYRFNMHMVDRDTSTDRQRQETKGMRWPAGGDFVNMRLGETWRLTHQMFIPSSLKATTTFTHIMQTKAPGSGTAPMIVMSLRRNGSTPTIEVKVFATNTLVGRVNLSPLQNKWIDNLLEFKIADGTGAYVRWSVQDGSTTVIDTTRTGVDTWLEDRVRPKWGIYRSLGDTSGSLQDCHLLLRAMRAYQLVAGTATIYQAENAAIFHGVVESNHAGYTGTGFVNSDNEVGSYVEWTVSAAAAGPATLTFRYANGTTTDRPMDIRVNGTEVAAGVSFPGTGAWTTWQTRSVTVPLNAGTNTIRATGTTANGGPNLDHLALG